MKPSGGNWLRLHSDVMASNLPYLSDLVRFALAKNAASVSGELAGGMVMSLIVNRETSIVVVVASNIAHAKTAELAQNVGEAFSR